MTDSKDKQIEARKDELGEVRAALAAKTDECDRLYRLVNRYKQQITDIDIALVTRDQTIEQLRRDIAEAKDKGDEK